MNAKTRFGILLLAAGSAMLAVADGGAGHAADRHYGIEVWELAPLTNSAVKTVLDYTPPDPVSMGGSRRGFGNGMKTPERIPVEEGTEYVLSFDGRVADPEGSFILYAKAFDEKGRDITTLTNPPGGGWQNSVSSSTYVIFAIPLQSTGAWHRVERSFLPPPGVKSARFEVSCWRGKEVACRRISITARQRYVRRRLDAAKDAIGIEISETPKPGGATAVRAKISDLSKPHRARALQVVLDWRKDLRGWTWHRNWRKDMPISEGSSYALGESIEGIPVSSYPFTAVSKDGEGFAVATALNAAAFEHRVTTAAGIRSMVAVGLLERGADRHGTSAEFEWLLFPFKGSWGFRSAARAYYDIEREHFPPSHAGEKEGAWVFATLPTKLPDNPDDFGLTFWEAPETVARDCPKEIVRARELGFNIFAYTEAWGMRQAIKKGADGRFPSESDLLDEIRGWAADAKSGKTWFSAPRHEAAQALLTSLPLTPDGVHPHTKDLYSNWSAWWSTNPDPRLPKPNRMSLCWDKRVGDGMDKVDGVYLDSVAYATPINYNNVRPEHLAVMDEPLVYDERTATPCANGMQHEVAFVRWIAGKLHPARKRIFANIARIALRFHADTIDIFGGETGSWGAPDAVARAHNVVPDDETCQRRFFAYHRPLLSLLQEGHWLRTPPEFTAEGMTNYINNQIFYGIYPGVSTIGGDEKPGYATWRRYFGPLRRCERDRALFKAAIPLIREMNRAGWDPETGFRTGSAKVLAERYGTPGGGKAFLAVRNVADAAADVEIRPEYALGKMIPRWGTGREPVCKDKIWRVRLDPWETAVYELQQ